MARNFRELLSKKWDEGKLLCVGLDTDLERIPEAARKGDTPTTVVTFNRTIVDATKDLVCAYKPNIAFYEQHGDQGWNALRETISYIIDVAPDVPVILDAKRGDIAHSNGYYVRAAFEHLRADAITIQPYAGKVALEPFLKQKDKGIIVWCRSSNEGAGEFQDLMINGEPLYIVVARHVVQEWNENGNCALVVGATYPDELKKIRTVAADVPILIPGIGAQDGDLKKTIQNGLDSNGRGLIVNASRSVLFASKNADYAEAARKKAQELHDAIRSVM